MFNSDLTWVLLGSECLTQSSHGFYQEVGVLNSELTWILVGGKSV